MALANAQMNLNKPYNNFYKDPSLGYPKFKSKKTNRPSYTTNKQKETTNMNDGYLKLPRIKNLIKIKQPRKFAGLIKSCTISKTAV
ncbi:MAG: hypothetical protein GX801_12055 [Fibrobacter sp.]|nr:hypothetical protein [Fibrobacter sp.]